MLGYRFNYMTFKKSFSWSWEYLFIFNYLFDIYLIRYHGVGMQQCQEMRQEGKNEEKTDQGRLRNHPPQPRQLILMYGRRRKEQKTEGRTKERNREWAPNPATWTIWLPLTTCMDHMVGLFWNPHLQGGFQNIVTYINEFPQPCLRTKIY